MPEQSLPLSLELRIDPACRSFETAWKARQHPRIEDYLGDAPEPDRSALLRELIRLDAEYRRQQDETPTPEDYRDRFPALDPAWLGAALAAPPATAPTRIGTSSTPAAAGPAETPAPAGQVTRIRCPHCHNPIQLVDERPDEVLCPGCGSSFRVRDTRPTTTGSGTRRLGKFQLLERVGLGAFGAVWKARDTTLDRVVALKVPHTGLLTADDDLERFHREARAAAQLRHPGIVTVHEVVTLDGLPVLVEDFVTGVPLKDLLEVRRLTFREAAALAAEVSDALEYAHGMEVVHRDVKPANIMVESGPPGAGGAGAVAGMGKPVVTDFGLALRGEAEITLTVEGQIIGTPAYMSPEQAAGQGHQVDRRSDVYSLGVVLYELLCGELPFRGSKMMMLHQVLHEEPRPPRRVNDKVPRDLETICLKCLEKEPPRRYVSAGELARDLRRFLANEPIVARPSGPLERTVKWVRRRPAQAALLLVSGLAALAVVGLAVGAVYNHQLRQARDSEEVQRRRAESNLEKAEQYLYFNRIGLAKRAWETNSISRARELLAECPAERRRWEWHYLDRLCHAELLTLAGHGDEILCVAVSPDGARLASGSKDRTVRLWDAKTGQELLKLPGHTAQVLSVAFSPDGRRLASAAGQLGERAEVKVWDVTAFGPGAAERREVLHLPGFAVKVAFSPDGRRLAVASGVVAGEKDGQVTVFDASSGRELFRPIPVRHGCTDVAFAPDVNRLAVAAGNPLGTADQVPGAVSIWDTDSRQELGRCNGHRSAVTALAFSPDGQFLATAGYDQTVRVWDAHAFRELHVMRGHRAVVRAVAFRPDGRALATGGEDGVVRVWDPAAGEELFALRGHTADVYSVAYLPDGSRLVSGGMDRVLHVWDATTGQEARTLRYHDGPVQDVAFSADGRWLASGGRDRTVQLWDLQAPGKPWILGRHADSVWCVAFSADSRLVASGAGDSLFKKGQTGEVAVWDVTTGGELFRRPGAPNVIWSVAFSPDGTRLAAGGGETSSGPGEVRVWDVAGQRLQSLPQPKGVWQVAFSPDGQDLAGVVTSDGTLMVWDAATWKQKYKIVVPACRLWSVAYSPDGRQLLAGGSDGSTRVWDAATGEGCDLQFRGHTSDVLGLALSPDGRRLATAGYDQTVKVWDTETGQELLTLRGHTGPVWRLAFSPDGHQLASGSDDGTVRLWDAASRQ